MVKTRSTKSIQLQYFAALREQRGLSAETVKTKSATAQGLYEELKSRHGFKLTLEQLKVAINGEFRDWNTLIKENDTLVFIPPVAGG